MRCHSPDKRGRDLAHAAVLAARIGVHLFQQLHLLLEARGLERIDVGIELDVAAGRGRGDRAGMACRPPPHGARRRARWRLRRVRWHGHSRWLRPPRRAGRSPGRCRRWPLSAGCRRRRTIRDWLYSRNSSPSSAPLSALIHGLLDSAAVHAGAGKEQIGVGHGVLRKCDGAAKSRRATV